MKRRYKGLLLILSVLSSTVSLALPNPASVNCIKKGGQVEIRENSHGQYGVCKWAESGPCDEGGMCSYISECGEWELLKGECKKGDCGVWILDIDASGNQITTCWPFEPIPLMPPPVA